MSGVRLRRAGPSDAAAIAALHLAARRQAMPWLPDLHGDEEVRGWVEGTLLSQAEVWIAAIASRPVGYLALAGDSLDHLYVGPEHQGGGVGSFLLEKAKALRPAGLRLYAFQRNRRARAFYEARGFVAIHFSDGAGNQEKEPDVLYEWRGFARRWGGMMFKALVLDKAGDEVTAATRQLDEAQLPEGDVTVAVECSTLNYKDGLIIKNKAPLVRSYPHVPGIDFAGTVLDSGHAAWRAGDAVILTGWGVGERHWGGHAQRARVKGDWLVPMPQGWTSRQAMAVGTAGFTAMLAVMALENHGLEPGDGEVLVTGAAGGVGSVAITLLAGLGHQVTASTGRAASHDYLRSLGASTLIDRAELALPSDRPLESERFVGCIDSVGGTTLARVLGQMKYRRSVAAVGLAGGSALDTTVIPFLLRGVNLLGIDSVYQPAAPRRAAWQRLARDLDFARLDAIIEPATLEDLPRLAGEILQGRVQGRVVVDLTG